MTKKKTTSIIPLEKIERRILVVRGEKALLDQDLAEMYGVKTKALIQAVKRNQDRFPEDFFFALTNQEFAALRSQIVTAKNGRGGRRTVPYVFTEYGALMAANVLKSPTAIEASIAIVRTFVRLREMAASHKELARKLTALENKYDHQFRVIFDAIRGLMEPPKPAKKRGIGFIVSDQD